MSKALTPDNPVHFSDRVDKKDVGEEKSRQEDAPRLEVEDLKHGIHPHPCAVRYITQPAMVVTC